MAQHGPPSHRQEKANGQKKRREHPTETRKDSHKRPKVDHRAKQRDARSLSTQTSSKAFRNGELDVDKFVKSREYEIRALEEGMAGSKKALTTRAFQHVPKELRRRTASHNAKRVPKRLQPRAKREMIEDNTPTVTARKRKPTRHMRLRLETAKLLRALGAVRKATNSMDTNVKMSTALQAAASKIPPVRQNEVKSRKPKVKKISTASPPLPKAKYRKRQIHKTWLPTHMFHAKRARMTAPKEPLWRFAIPLTPTAKSYRPTHRAANASGAVAWDTSYVSTISLEGQQSSIEGILKAVGLDPQHLDQAGVQSQRWLNGTRVVEQIAFEREPPHRPIAPITVIWCVPPMANETQVVNVGVRKRRVFIRVHPSAFWQLWEEIGRLAKVAKPQVNVQDLRFEIGSIEITGPAASEALHAALWPSPSKADTKDHGSVEQMWNLLAGLADLALLPSNVLLGLEIQDPRLHHPPRKVAPQSPSGQETLLELLASWPVDATQGSPTIFERRSRFAAASALPSQKSINRRKSLAAPGESPQADPKDPKIPVLLYQLFDKTHAHSPFTVLLPWKCVQPVWYSLMYCPLSTGGQPRFGGLDEKRQLAFEHQQPWFPADFPGTQAGWQWEVERRIERKDEWKRKPKSKRTNWDSVDIGCIKKGEVGVGWACDWERLLTGSTSAGEATTTSSQLPMGIVHLPRWQAQNALRAASSDNEVKRTSNGLATVRIKLLTRGTPQTCARIYRLPSTAETGRLRNRWLNLHPRQHPKQHQGSTHGLPRLPKDAPAYLVQRKLAQSLLKPPQVGEENYPNCPEEEDLIGFITTGNYNLAEGQGTGIGSILLSKVVEDVRQNGKDGRLCIVRNAGNNAGRLAIWEIA